MAAGLGCVLESVTRSRRRRWDSVGNDAVFHQLGGTFLLQTFKSLLRLFRTQMLDPPQALSSALLARAERVVGPAHSPSFTTVVAWCKWLMQVTHRMMGAFFPPYLKGITIAFVLVLCSHRRQKPLVSLYSNSFIP